MTIKAVADKPEKPDQFFTLQALKPAPDNFDLPAGCTARLTWWSARAVQT